MRLTRRIEKMEAVVGPPRPRDLWGPPHPRRCVSELEANEAFLRLLNTNQADVLALVENAELPLWDKAASKRDVETLHHWSWQRGLPHDTDVARARQQSLEILSDDQLAKLERMGEEARQLVSGQVARP